MSWLRPVGMLQSCKQSGVLEFYVVKSCTGNPCLRIGCLNVTPVYPQLSNQVVTAQFLAPQIEVAHMYVKGSKLVLVAIESPTKVPSRSCIHLSTALSRSALAEGGL